MFLKIYLFPVDWKFHESIDFCLIYYCFVWNIE